MYELPRQPFMLTNDLNERHEHSVCIRELQNGTVPCKQHEPFGFDQYYVTHVQIQIGMYVNHVTIHKYYRSEGGASVVCFEPFVSIQLPSFKRDDAMIFVQTAMSKSRCQFSGCWDESHTTGSHQLASSSALPVHCRIPKSSEATGSVLP